MAIQDAFIKQLEAQIQNWEKQANDYRARMDKAGAQARSDYEKQLKSVEGLIGEATKMLSQAQQANQAAWKDIEQSTAQAFETLKKGWDDAMKRFQ